MSHVALEADLLLGVDFDSAWPVMKEDAGQDRRNVRIMKNVD